MKLTVTYNNLEYDVIIERNSLDKASTYLNLNRKVLVVTDSLVPTIYAKKVLEQAKTGYLYVIESGEKSKNLENYTKIIDYLIQKEFSRSDCIVAVGGGVVGDLAGFVSSTYMRGIDFYNIPTTLLAQVDSSIGGKTAIDYNGIKNVVGAFYPPMKVLIDPETLQSLDNRQLHSGLVEAIKMSLTSNKDLFELIEKSTDLNEDLEQIIIEALKIKKAVVEIDPKEQNLRRILNFGHTIGHAIESSGKFNDLLHGEAVGIGMLYFSSTNVKNRLLKVLEKYNLPTTINLTQTELMKYINLDKKRSGNKITIVKVDEIGSYILEKINLEEIKNYL
jgi:3-dehydroquinate synthase